MNNNSNNLRIDEQALERELSGSLDNDPLAVLQQTARPVPPQPAQAAQPRILEQSRNLGPAPVASAPSQAPRTVPQQPRVGNAGPGGAVAADPTGNIIPVRTPAPAAQQPTVGAGIHAGKTHMDAVHSEVQKERASIKSQRANNIAVTERNIAHYNDNIELNEGARRVARDEQSAKFDERITTTQNEIARVQAYLEQLNNTRAEEVRLKQEVLAEIEATFNDKHDDLLALRDSEQARLDVLKRQSIRDEQKETAAPVTEEQKSLVTKSRPNDYVLAT